MTTSTESPTCPFPSLAACREAAGTIACLRHWHDAENEEPVADDGFLACVDCGAPACWDEAISDYVHVPSGSLAGARPGA